MVPTEATDVTDLRLGDRIWHTLAVSKSPSFWTATWKQGSRETQGSPAARGIRPEPTRGVRGRRRLVILWTRFESLMVALLGVATLIAVAMGRRCRQSQFWS